MPSYQPKVALVHDDWVQTGGAESLFTTIAEIFPNAPIYTSLADWDKLPSEIDHKRIKTSFIQKIPLAKYFFKALLPIYPLAFESFDFSNYDLVISSTTRFAKGIITKPKTIHVSYVNSIPRFLWEDAKQQDYLNPIIRLLVQPALIWLKKWDRVASARVDRFIANSQNVKKKIKKVYGQNSAVVYPFADASFFTLAKVHNWELKSENYYLVVTRLVKWKKIDIAIAATLDLDINLKIVGIGPDEKRLESLSITNHKRKTKNGVEFLGKISKEKLRELYRNCRALIICQDEDFGISAVEAQACGTPVIAYGEGGVKEIVIDGKSGVIFNKQSKESLKDAIIKASKLKWNVAKIRQNALRFSKSNFVKSINTQVENYVKSARS